MSVASHERVFYDRLVELAATRREAIAANDIGQYRDDIRVITNRIDMILDLMVDIEKGQECGRRVEQ